MAASPASTCFFGRLIAWLVPHLSAVVLLLGVCSSAAAQTTAPKIPDTPAGHVLQAWLDAFNSGDRAKVESYIKTYDPNDNVEGLLGFRRQTGGFDLLSVEDAGPLELHFRVKDRNTPTVGYGSLQLKPAEPHQVENLGLRALPPGATIENVTLDAAARQRVIDGVASNLKEYYVTPEVGQKMIDAVQAHARNGDYNTITSGDVFAARLTKDMRDVSHDFHLGVSYSPFKTPPPPPDQHGPTPEEQQRFHKELARNNCTWEKAEVRDRNVGYIRFDAFIDPDYCGPTVVAAMNFLAHTDALIIDLRGNGGGDPRMVSFILSYLFDEPTHVNDLYDRHEDKTTQYWTAAYVPGTRLPKVPVFVLTSHRTFSGAEEFTYDLKNLKRATIVGEVTGGGAHPVGGHRIDDHFDIGVPFARAINPISKTDWEGTGVQPDVAVPADEALDRAQKLAEAKLAEAKPGEGHPSQP